MSKAVLIMDMPETCDECPLLERDYGTDYEPHCMAEDKYIESNERIVVKPDWCPLFIPQKRDIKDEGYFNSDVEQMVRQAEIDNYNEAIDDILGE